MMKFFGIDDNDVDDFEYKHTMIMMICSKIMLWGKNTNFDGLSQLEVKKTQDTPPFTFGWLNNWKAVTIKPNILSPS